MASMMLTVGFLRHHVIWPCSLHDLTLELSTDGNEKKHPSHRWQMFGLHLREPAVTGAMIR
jgi:hypothetical protein